MRVFVDYDGTMTDRDTFDALANEFGGEEAWQQLEEQFASGAMTHRQALAAQAGLLRCSFDEADAFVQRSTRIDPTFRAFAQRCEREHVPLTILSSGLGPLIVRALERAGLSHVPLVANGAHPHENGWIMEFCDDSDKGHDKAAAVRRAHEAGDKVVFVGDGISDYAAALESDRVFAKRGRPLERYLRERGLSCTVFESFDEIERLLFG